MSRPRLLDLFCGAGDKQRVVLVAEPTPATLGDHPHYDPGDGRTQCAVCGKWVYLVTHSCKGIRVAPPDWFVKERKAVRGG